MKAFITFSIVVLLVMISVSQASKGMHSKLELLFGVFLFFCCCCLFVSFLCFLQVKMNIKKNNNLCTKTKKQFKQINELRRVGGGGGGGSLKKK